MVLDDDIRFIVRRYADSTQLEPIDDKGFAVMMEWVEELLKTYAHVGIGVRGGNNNVGTGDAPLLTENTRTMRALAYRTDDFLSVEHGRVQVMEDFDVNLQLLRKGLKNCNINYWCQDQKMTNAAGGCSGLRTHALHEAAAVRLAELHPGLVALRQKKNKTGGVQCGTMMSIKSTTLRSARWGVGRQRTTLR
jgi:hypothetical protein